MGRGGRMGETAIEPSILSSDAACVHRAGLGILSPIGDLRDRFLKGYGPYIPFRRERVRVRKPRSPLKNPAPPPCLGGKRKAATANPAREGVKMQALHGGVALVRGSGRPHRFSVPPSREG
jgi:hypothetical protein